MEKRLETAWVPIIENGSTYWLTNDGFKTIDEMTDKEIEKHCEHFLKQIELIEILNSEKFQNLKLALEQLEKERYGSKQQHRLFNRQQSTNPRTSGKLPRKNGKWNRKDNS